MRRPLPIFRRSIADSWRSVLGWCIGVAGALFLYLPLYPSFGANGELQQIIDSLPQELVKTLGYEQISSGPGYAQSTFYGLIGFLLLTIAATSWGSASIAGAEESGALELTLAHGVGRTRFALESALSLVVRLVVVGAVAAAIVLALNDSAELSIDPPNVAAATAALVGLTLLSGSLALFAGALTGRRVVASAVGAGVAVFGYVANAIANQVADAEWLRSVSPYSWAYGEQPLAEGADWAGLALLWGFSALFVLAATFALRRRDVLG